MKRQLGLIGFLVCSVSLAQDPAASNQFMHMIEASMKAMDRSMASAPMNGDVDHIFASMMIPHHNGAIDMAKAELRFGKDPVMRRMAQEILIEQQSEIDAMTLWMSKKH